MHPMTMQSILRRTGDVAQTGRRSQSARVAFCGLMAALGAALMLTGGIIPVLTYCSPLLAALLLIPVTQEYGAGRGWMVWAVTALLSMILTSDREAAFFYVFLGYYPIIKGRLDKLRPGLAAFAAKLLLFAAALAAMYGLLLLLFREDAGMEELRSAGIAAFAGTWAALVVVMCLYDRILVMITALYRRRIRPKLRFDQK